MAAAWQSGARGFSAANVSSLATAAFTISGSDRYLEVLAYSGAGTPQNITSVVWDAAGVNEALTQVESYITSNTYFRSSKWALVNPTAGTSKTVTVTWASNQDETMVIADSYTGIDQATPSRTRPTPSQTSTSTPSLSVTSVSGDLVVGAVAFNDLASGGVTTISSSAVTIREKIEGADVTGYESCAQGDVTATGTSTSVGFTCSSGGAYYPVLFGVALIPSSGGGAATATTFTGPSTGVDDVQSTDFTVGANGTITGTVTCTFTNSLSGTWSFATRDISSGTPTQTVKYTPSVPGTHVLGVTDNGGLTDATSINYVVAAVSRPSAVTPNTWTDEAGGSLVVADINDASDSTGAKDPAGASYPVLAFTATTPLTAASQTFYFRGRDIAAGKQARQVIYANDGTTVVATGAWKTMTGSDATYSDVLTPTATAYKGQIQTQGVPSAVYGVIWPSNPDTDSDVRLNWTGAASVSRTAQTIIWKSNYEQQDGYYAVWWRLPDAAATFDSLSDWTYGTHPWPGTTSVNGAGAATGGTGSTGTVHQFEIAAIGAGADYITSPSAANGGPFTVTKGVWQTEAATVEVISGTTLRHTYWPDISNPTSYIQQDRVLGDLDTPTAERVVFGGSPWTADIPTSGKNAESASGTFRYWKIFDAALSITDIATEAASNSDSAVTTAGIASAFYSNINPTPTDVTDKSGNGNDPAWANANRPTLYTG